mgnify:CR=1 FL=1
MGERCALSYISAIGTYVPRLRLSRAAMVQATGWLGGAATSKTGARSLAFWDEDSTTMAVEAARHCLAQWGGDRSALRHLTFATTTPAFREPQNALFVHAALRLQADCLTQDASGTTRAGLLALQQALEQDAPALLTVADRPDCLPASLAESRSGDGAAAVVVGTGTPLLRYRGGASVAAPLMDRYAAADGKPAVEWEERWLREEGFLKLVPQAIAKALQHAGLAAGDIDTLVMPCVISGCGAAVLKAVGLHKARLTDPLSNQCGDTGTAHALLMLAHAVETMKAGERIMLVQCAQGATALVLQAEAAITQAQTQLAAHLAQGIAEDNYMKLLVFRGLVAWDRGLRGRQGVAEALSTSYRYHDALLGFVGGKCCETGRVQFPPTRLGVTQAGAGAGGSGNRGLLLDTQEPYPLADRGGQVATCTADRLAFSRHPPHCYGLVDFTGGGRLMMDFTDPDAAALQAGSAVRFVFRIKDLDEQTGYRRYFWKAVSDGFPQSVNGH